MVRTNCQSDCQTPVTTQLSQPPCLGCITPESPFPDPTPQTSGFNLPPSPNSLKPNGTILAGSGITPQYAATSYNNLIELFLVPIWVGRPMIGPADQDGKYVANITPGTETSVAFGITRFHEWDFIITDLYDVTLTIEVGAASHIFYLKSVPTTTALSGYVWHDIGNTYVITDSPSTPDLSSAQNASRLRYLVNAGFLPVGSNIPGSSVWTLLAVHKTAGEIVQAVVDLTVNIA